MQEEKKAALIGIDWGTTSFRAYLMDAEGIVLDIVSSSDGILSVKNHEFEDLLNKNIERWLLKYRNIPILASGMITSKNGWLETPYLQLPALTDGFADVLSTIKLSKGHDVYFVTGASTDRESAAPDIMRGEETQVVGALYAIDKPGAQQIFLLPGTHSKWVVTEKNTIKDFMTFMTGEIYALLKDHSILGTLIDASNSDISSGFLKGVRSRIDCRSSLLHQLFSARTLVLFDKLPKTEIADYLSGLLIGEELKSAITELSLGRQTNMKIVGGESLTARYALALDELEIEYQIAPNDIVAIGHFKIAKKAGLVK